MAEEQPGSSQAASRGEDAPQLVNLQIVSPTVGVGNLRFPDLPAATTLRQLREKIREALASRPPDDHQRLIYHGRLLTRNSDTLRDVLGEAAIRSSDQQTIHLVLRDAPDQSGPGHTSAQATPTPSQPGNAQSRPPDHPDQIRRRVLLHGQMLRNIPSAALNTPMPGSGSAPTGAPRGTPHFSAHHQQQHQQQHQELLQRIAQLQEREAHYRHLLDQYHNVRFSAGYHITQNGTGHAQRNPADIIGEDITSIMGEIVGPDGEPFAQRIRAPTATRPPGPTSDPVGRRPRSAADVYNIVRGANASRAAQAMASAMQRSASGASQATAAAGPATFDFNGPIQPIQPGVTARDPSGVSWNASRTISLNPSSDSANHASGSAPSIPQSRVQGAQPGQPEVFILSSPTGPQALLINSTSDIYITTTNRAPSWTPSYYLPPSFPYSLPAQANLAQLPVQRAARQVTITVPGPAQVQIQAQQQAPPLVQPQPQPQARNDPPAGLRQRPVAVPAGPPPALRANHPGNPGAGALVAAAWPHVWLAIRLMAFAWWFSYSDPSWQRWLSLALAFLVVFAINTGILNGIVNNAFHPVREHLEGMIPFADPNRQQWLQQQQGQRAGEGVQTGGNGEAPDPAQVAARLVEQRRAANGNWLRDQVRRIQRATVLFAASFAPGVAEGHIQQLEERERAERRAQEEARAAAAAQAAAQQATADQPAQVVVENQQGPEGQQESGRHGTSQAAEQQT
ncbi:hypothetical protein VTK56DRAFT_163 [Thermocarpiscus australiensis]